MGGRAARRRRARRARARVRRRSTAAHDRLLRRAGRARLRRPRAAAPHAPAAEHAARPRARRRPLCATCSSTTSQDLELAAAARSSQLLAAEHGEPDARPATTTRRSGACAAPARRSCATLAADVAGRRVDACAWALAPLRRARCRRRGGRRRRADRGPPGQGPVDASGRAATRALLALRERARAGPGRGRPRSSGSCARASRPARSGCSCAPCAARARRSPSRSRSARCRYRLAGARGVLPARRGQGRAGVAAAARRPLRRGRGRPRAVARRRSSCAPSTSRAASRSPGGASSTWSTALVAATESPQLPPEARERVLGFLKLHRVRGRRAGHDAARPLRPPARRAPRAAPRSRSSPRRPTSSSGCVRWRSSASSPRPTCAARRRRPRASSRATSPRWPRPAARRRRGRGPRTAPRGDAVAVLPMHAAKRDWSSTTSSSAACSPSRMPGARRRGSSSRSPTRCWTSALPPDTREAHVDEMRRLLHVGDDRAPRGARAGLRRARRARRRRSPRRRSPRRRARRSAPSGTTARRSSSAPTRRCTRRSARCATSCCATSRGSARGWASCGSTPTSTSPTASSRYLELLKLAALHAPPEGQAVADALPGINAAILHAATAQQREILQTSSLDDVLLRRRARRPRPRGGDRRARTSRRSRRSCRGAARAWLLSASDIETYRTCPLKYKFARVFRVPQRADDQPALRDRRPPGARALPPVRRADRSTSCWGCSRRAGGAAASAAPTRSASCTARPTAALRRYHERFQADDAEPMWFEKRLQLPARRAHAARPRRPRRPAARRRATSSSTTRRAARRRRRSCARTSSSRSTRSARREAWQLDAVAPVLPLRPRRREGPGADRRTSTRTGSPRRCAEVADGILGQGFEPTPSYAACSMCDYRIACPAAER